MAKKANNPFARTLISNANMDPAQKFRIEEAYKSIRTNIMLSILKKGCKTIVVSSGSPAEGKTTTTINLAISIAQADQRVLLIDCDLRKPKMHHYFGVSNAPGLTNYISDSVKNNGPKTDLYSIIHRTEFSNLSLLCAGSIPAYHMRKDSWITVALDGSVADDKIKMLLDVSYQATAPKVRKKKG